MKKEQTGIKSIGAPRINMTKVHVKTPKAKKIAIKSYGKLRMPKI